MTLKFTNVTVDVLNKNRAHSAKYLRLVNDISGEFHYNELTAIMGPSGCGKSTFIASLVGRIQHGSKTSGSITVDDEEREYRSFIKNVGMLEQDDNIFPTLSLYETLSYTIKFHGIKPATGIEAYIDEILKSFGLTNSKYNHMIKLSGGERKRAMLAIELVTDPKIIFADEPTSGLDTTTAFNIMQLLKTEANKGKMVIVCIHQPSAKIYDLFDKLVLMTEAQIVYHGPAASFEQYLKDKNITKGNDCGTFADFIVDMVMEENNVFEENLNYPLIQKLIEENHGPENPTKKIRNKNDTVHDYKINPYHIWLIQSRNWKLTLQNKFKILKSVATYVLFSLVTVAINSYLFDSFFKDQNIQRFLSESQNNSNDVRLDLLEQCTYMISRLMTVFYSSFFIGVILASSTGAFFNSSSIIKREISAGCYSSTSYVLGLYIFYIVRTFTYMIPATIIFLIKHRNKVTLSVIAVHAFGPIFLIPVSFAIGSISKNKKLVLAINSFLSMPLLLTPSFIFKVIGYAMELTQATLRYIALGAIGVLSFSPTFYFSAFYMLIQQKIFSCLHKIPDNMTDYLYEPFNKLRELELDEMSNYNLIFSFIYMTRISMISIYVGMTMLVMLFALWRQSQFLMPAIRMKL